MAHTGEAMGGRQTQVGRPPRPRRGRFHPVAPWIPWAFVAPFLLIFTLFTAIPGISAFVVSFTDMSTRDLRNPLGIDFVGLDTFVRVLGDPTFLRSVLNTGMFVVLVVPTTMVIGFVIALILDTGVRRMRPLFRAAIYVPVITNVVAAAMIWQYAFTIEGPLNSLLTAVGLPALNWLGNPVLAVPTVALLGIWRTIGICMILFLAGLQTIPSEIQEAAAIDGAGYMRRLRSITIPLLQPTILLVSVLMMIFFLNIFDEPYLVTGGGPLGSTKTIALWVFGQFGFGDIAQAMAASFLLLGLIGLVSAAQFRLLRPTH